MMLSKFGSLAASGLALSCLMAGPGFAFNNVYTVTTTNDTVDANPGDGVCADANGLCSLRAAIQEANAAGGCVTNIELQPGAAYRLTRFGAGENASLTGDLDVTGWVILRGAGATVDAMSADRAFDVISPGRIRAIDVIVRNGRVVGESGGGFRSNDTLHLIGSNVINCVATGAGASGGGIFNDGGDLQLVGCSVRGGSAERAGGAIEANAGTTSIDASRIFSNTTGPGPGNGGGFHLTGPGSVAVTQSIVWNNSAAREGGGLWNSSTGVMVIDGTTVRDNEALGATSDDGGGGLFNDGGTMSVTRSFVTNNVAPVGSGSGGGIFNNGGELEVTWSAISGNSANRAGGGIEALQGTTTLFTSELSANATGSVPGNGGGLHLTGAGIVNVSLTDVLDNTASAEGGGLWNSAVGTMNIEDSLVSGNVASGVDPDQGGGGLFNDGGDMTVLNSVMRGNTADGAAGSGGGALNLGGTLTVSGSRFEGNDAQRAGGGVEANAGTTDLDDVVLIRNSTGAAPGNGGGLHLTGMGNVTVDDSVVHANTAAAEGGGLWNSAVGTMSIVDCDIDANIASGADADQGGGGVFNDGGAMTIDGGVISNNIADGAAGSGGGILNNQGVLDVSMTTIWGNDSQRAGGGIEANVGTTTLSRVRLDANTTGSVPGNGGGLHLTGPGLVQIDESSVTRSDAANEGGGLWNSLTGTMTVTQTRIADNTAPTGPDVFNDGGTMTIDGKDVPPGP